MEKVYEYIQVNAQDATISEIDYVYAKHNGDLLETLIELLKIPPKIEKEQNEWEKRREICDTHDAEMYKQQKTKTTTKST